MGKRGIERVARMRATLGRQASKQGAYPASDVTQQRERMREGLFQWIHPEAKAEGLPPSWENRCAGNCANPVRFTKVQRGAPDRKNGVKPVMSVGKGPERFSAMIAVT